MKKRFLNFLIWLISKLDNGYLKRCSIDTKVEADFTNFIPDDGKWHHFATTVEYWLKVDGTKIEKKEMWMDDIRVSSTLRDIGGVK